MSELVHLAIVDDDEYFRKGLVSFVNAQKDFHVLIEASNGKELIKALEFKKPQIVLLDLEMPVMNGYKTTSYLSKYHHDIKILILTSHDDNGTSHELIKSGANGFLQKSFDLYKLQEAIYAIHQHEYYFAGWCLKDILNSRNTESKTIISPKITFSKRELEIIELISLEYTNKEISARLNLSTRTIDAHRDRILEKAKVRNTAGLVVFAAQCGIIKI